MTFETKELSRGYQIWLVIQNNPDIKMPDIAKAMGSNTQSISDAITKLVKAENIISKGKRGARAYSVRESNPPEMYGRGSYCTDKPVEKPVYFLKPTPGNSVFDECRANWQGYQLNQYLREVRA